MMKKQNTIPIPPEGKIFIKETFSSIQGEGFHTGIPAFFIRFAGCDIGCIWCDSKDAWSVNNARLTSYENIIREAIEQPKQMIVITGGEPAIYDLREITREIRKAGKKVHLETSGAYPVLAEFDWLTLSPKQIILPLAWNYKLANELKIVINNPDDLSFAKEQAHHVKSECRLFLQPQWGRKKEIMPLLLSFIQDNPAWRLSVQLHKYLRIP